MRRLLLLTGLLLAACMPAGPAPQTPPPDMAQQVCIDAFLIEGSALRREVASSDEIECEHDEMSRTLKIMRVDDRAHTVTARVKSAVGVMGVRFAVPLSDPAENLSRLVEGVALPGGEPVRIIVPPRTATVAGRALSYSAIVFASPKDGVALVCVLGNPAGTAAIIAMVCRGTTEIADGRMRAKAERIVAEDFSGIRW